MIVNSKVIYEGFKKKAHAFDEEKHCKMIIDVMADPHKGRVSSFCVEAMICETTFYNWCKKSELFKKCYSFGKQVAREIWEELGREIANEEGIPGTQNHKFEWWRQVGWVRFGVGKCSRLRLEIDHKADPNTQYQQLLEQATDGDFTAGEIKQLMESINVGLRAHELIALQNQVKELKADLELMRANSQSYGNSASTVKGTEKED